MEVMPAYTQTDVGLIPSEWAVKEFRQIGHLSKGRGLLKEDIKTSGAVPAIPYTALYTDFSEGRRLWVNQVVRRRRFWDDHRECAMYAHCQFIKHGSEHRKGVSPHRNNARGNWSRSHHLHD